MVCFFLHPAWDSPVWMGMEGALKKEKQKSCEKQRNWSESNFREFRPSNNLQYVDDLILIAEIAK